MQSSESPAIPKWKQELREKKRLQKERQGERQKDNIQPQQSGVRLDSIKPFFARGTIRNDPYWTSMENSLELIVIEPYSINNVSLV